MSATCNFNAEMNRQAVAMSSEDRKRIRATLNREARLGVRELRMRAAVFLTWTSGIRLSEMLALRMSDALDRVERGWRVREIIFLDESTAKKFASNGVISYATGKIFVDRPAREALRAYLVRAIRDGIVLLPVSSELRLFFGPHGEGALHPRSIQYEWRNLQKRADVVNSRETPRYRWHDLRHCALTSIASAGNVFDVQKAGRFKSLANASRYVHPSDERIFELIDKSARR